MFWKKDPSIEIKNELNKFYPRLWRYCLVLTGDRDKADDLAQMASLRAIEKADQYKPGTHVDRWVFKIAQRTWINELRKQAVRIGGGLAPIEEIELPDTKADIETNFLAHQALLEVMALPEAQRVTVMLVYVEGYSYKEAAEALDIPIGTVMSRLSVARAKLAEKLDRESKVG